MKARLTVAATSSIVLLTSCASGHPQAAPVATKSASVTPSPTPTPSPTRLTLTQARALYLRLVKPSNNDITAANKIMTSSSPSLNALHRIAHKARLDEHRFAIGLRTSLWPTDVQAVAQRLADAVAAEVPTWTALASDTAEQANSDWTAFAGRADKSGALAEQMRERLGLPPAK